MAVRLSNADYAALQAGKPLPLSEDAIQSQIVTALRAHGYTVLVTSRRRKKCRKCGSYEHSGDGADKGVPDLLVGVYGDADWPQGTLLGMEVKRPGKVKYSSREQELYVKLGLIVVVQSVEQAIALAEARLKL